MTQRGENFIPWEQIETLTKPGMTLRELGKAISVATGFTPEAGYGLVWACARDSARESLWGGLLLVKRDSQEFVDAPHFDPFSVIA